MTKLIVGNWKMNPAAPMAADTISKSIKKELSKIKNTGVVICPPFLYTQSISKILGKGNISLGAQDAAVEKEGACTGEVSVAMLKNTGVSFIILGHSEKRKAGDTSEIINKKLLVALKEKMIPIVCVGESVRDDAGKYHHVIQEDIQKIFAGVSKVQLASIVIAYEPIWAIGKSATREATPEECREMMIFIKRVFADLYHQKVISSLKILFGGSVNPKNAASFLSDGGADGLLVGRDSLDPKKFAAIVSVAEQISK